MRLRTMMGFLSAFMGAVILVAIPAAAQVTDLSERKIEIRYSFEGADLILFGTTGKLNITGPYDVVVVVRGPDVPSVVRKKDRKFGIWMNDAAMVFPSAPGYYAVAATKQLNQIAGHDELEKYGIGFENLVLELDQDSTRKSVDPAKLTAFKQALYRGRAREELYRQGQDGVHVVGEGLFRTNIHIPANVPVGDFKVNAFIFQDGQMVGQTDVPMVVSKEGFERAVYDYAHQSPFLYGLTAVFIALSAGWLAGIVGLKKN